MASTGEEMPRRSFEAFGSGLTPGWRQKAESDPPGSLRGVGEAVGLLPVEDGGGIGSTAAYAGVQGGIRGLAAESSGGGLSEWRRLRETARGVGGGEGGGKVQEEEWEKAKGGGREGRRRQGRSERMRGRGGLEHLHHSCSPQVEHCTRVKHVQVLDLRFLHADD